jgi:hypothetical protein
METDEGKIHFRCSNLYLAAQITFQMTAYSSAIANKPEMEVTDKSM